MAGFCVLLDMSRLRLDICFYCFCFLLGSVGAPRFMDIFHQIQEVPIRQLTLIGCCRSMGEWEGILETLLDCHWAVTLSHFEGFGMDKCHGSHGEKP